MPPRPGRSRRGPVTSIAYTARHMSTAPIERPKASSPRSLSGLGPFLRPYRGRIFLALAFMVLAAVATLVLPVALKTLIDEGLVEFEDGGVGSLAHLEG